MVRLYLLSIMICLVNIYFHNWATLLPVWLLSRTISHPTHLWIVLYFTTEQQEKFYEPWVFKIWGTLVKAHNIYLLITQCISVVALGLCKNFQLFTQFLTSKESVGNFCTHLIIKILFIWNKNNDKMKYINVFVFIIRYLFIIRLFLTV